MKTAAQAEEITLTDHAKEKSIPNFEIYNILEKDQGRKFYDKKHDSIIQLKGKTVVAYKIDGNKATVVTCYRNKYPGQFKQDRFEEIRL